MSHLRKIMNTPQKLVHCLKKRAVVACFLPVLRYQLISGVNGICGIAGFHPAYPLATQLFSLKENNTLAMGGWTELMLYLRPVICISVDLLCLYSPRHSIQDSSISFPTYLCLKWKHKIKGQFL